MATIMVKISASTNQTGALITLINLLQPLKPKSLVPGRLGIHVAGQALSRAL